MDQIKEAFQKVKQDIDSLYHGLNNLRVEMNETRQEMGKIVQILSQISDKLAQNQPKTASTHNSLKPTASTHPSTHQHPPEPLKPQNMPISTGNEGVPTDRQTDRQTHNKPPKQPEIEAQTEKIFLPEDSNSIDNAAKILDSLDSIKKDIRLKFKRLTEQEILVFSTLYQIDEETGPTDYKTLADRLKLTECSIRDYIGRLIKKGIPVEKKRINNKMIQLSVSDNLKKIASLTTILRLRDI